MIDSALRSSLGGLVPGILLVASATALFLLLPVLIVFPMSLTRDVVLTWPPHVVSLRWFSSLLDDPAWTNAFAQSLKIAVPVSAIATALGTLAAIGLAYARRARRALQTLFIAPLILPLITYALGLYDVSDRLAITDSLWPVVVGQATLATPLVFIVVSAGMASRDRLLPVAAASLGAGWKQILWRVELPLVRGSIVAGGLLAFAASFDEVIVAYFLLPPGEGTLPVQILASTRESADPVVAAASIVVIAVAVTSAAAILVARALLSRRTTA